MTTTPDRRTGSSRFLAGVMTAILILGLAGLALAALVALVDLPDAMDGGEGFGLILAAHLAVPSALATLGGALGGRLIEWRGRYGHPAE